MRIGGWASFLAVAAIVTACRTDSPASPGPGSAGPGPAEGRHITGIPLSVGEDPVFIGLAAAAHAAATTDATPFFIGGWFNDTTVFMCSGGIGRDPSPLLSGCATGIGGETPLVSSSGVGQTHVFWDGITLPDGVAPAILGVHTHDARMGGCRPESLPACAAVVVVEGVLWSGDASTETGPISLIDASRSLDDLNIITSFQTGPMESLSVERTLFTRPVDAPCPSPWPRHVFKIHGDPQFGLLAVFPDEAARVEAQAALDLDAPGCAIDPRIERAEPPAWAAHQNVLALIYGEEARFRMQGALDGTIDRDRFTGFPPEDLDESYRVVDDAMAMREAGNLSGSPLLPFGDLEADPIEDLFRRFQANALSYVIGDGAPATEAAVGAEIWDVIEAGAVPDTAVLYVVDHPESTDADLREEQVVAFRLSEPSVDTWHFIVVPRAGR